MDISVNIVGDGLNLVFLIRRILEEISYNAYVAGGLYGAIILHIYKMEKEHCRFMTQRDKAV